MTAAMQHCDIAIIGAGLAGATLALQLKSSQPSLAITVFERSSLPPPVAAHKVGESTVEIGSHYLSHTLQLKELLEQSQLRKFGLRFFFDADRQTDIAQADELGASDYFDTRSYQIDRGALEGSLTELMVQRGINLLPDTRVQSVTLSSDSGMHRLTTRNTDHERQWSCGFVVDAAARASLLQRQLGLSRPTNHKACSAWFRIDAPIEIDDWSANAAWKSRCGGQTRRLSTNHLMGVGYWLWIIPLVGNRTSIGLVTDPAIHPLEEFNSLPGFLSWAQQHQPGIAAQLQAMQGSVMDFHFLRDLSRDSRQTLSADGWAMAGEAGLFADPFYSPGTDYIGIGNGFITDLIAHKENQPEMQQRAKLFNALYRSFFGSTMSLYQQQYAGFGDIRLMAVKSTWDYAYYWSVLAWMFFREVLTDLEFLRVCEPDLRAMLNLNSHMQSLFRQRASQRITIPGQGRFIDQKAIPILPRLNRSLLSPELGLRAELQQNRRELEALMAPLEQLLQGDQRSALAECSLLGDLAKRLA